MDIQITAFPARNGESLFIECYGEEKTNILIDMGFSETYNKFIRQKLKNIAKKGEKIDLLVLTHYDSDHVEGAVEFFKDLSNEKFIEVEEIWINDFYSLSSEELNVQGLDQEGEFVYKFARFISRIYGRDNSKINKVEVSKEDVMSITKLINELGYNCKINKSLEHRLACIHESNNAINISKDVIIKIIGPTKLNMEKLSKQFCDWIKDNRELYLDIEEEELFEIFVANIDKNEIDDVANIIKKVEISSGKNDDTINKILKENKKYNDYSLANRSSISFILEFNGYKLIFSGDTDTTTLINNISTEDNYDLLKVSHHGSKKNTSRDLLEKINCKNYLICTDGSGRSRHPNLETLLYISEHEDSKIYTNYPINRMSISKQNINILKSKYKMNLYENTSIGQPFIIIFKDGELIWKKENH